jgi:hypothetical protein
MSLRDNIRRILFEETNRDLSPVIENLVTKLIVNSNKDIICGVKVTHPDKRTKTQHFDNNFKNYRIDFHFIGGIGTEYYPKTKEVIRMYVNLMEKTWDLIYEYTGKPLDMFGEYTKNCE